jgi:hypothetical protein
MTVISSTLIEDRLTFNFPVGSIASKYDEWSHYRNQVQPLCGASKAVDIVFADHPIAWLIEIKDYRQHKRTKAIDLGDEVAQKVRDTIVGLVSTRLVGNNDDERDCARQLLLATRIRVVCHLEQPARQSRLRPRAIEPDKLVLKLRTLLKAIDPHPSVVDSTSLSNSMRWTVTPTL